MHILHIINNCNAGGAGHVVLPLIAEHRKQNIKFTIAYLEGPEALKEEYQKLGADTILLGKAPMRIICKLSKILSDKKDPVSLIHTHLVHASLIGRMMGIIYKKPIITTRHYHARSKKYNLLYMLEDYTSRWSDAIVAISDAVNRHVTQMRYTKADRCITIYNPISMQLFKSNTRSTRSSKKNIVCNARFIRIKGVEYLVHAFEKVGEMLPESKLVLIGRFNNDSQIIKKIKTHKYSDRIILRGFIHREAIIDELSLARIYVQPSLSEGLGLAAIEAMGMKCPCIFTSVGGLVELSQEGVNAVMVPPKNSKLLGEEIVSLWENEEKAIKLGESASNYVSQNFNSVEIAEKYLQLYFTTLKERKN